MVAILSPDAVPKVRMTVDEYLPADLPEGYRYELVNGVVEMSPPPSPEHEYVLYRLIQLLDRYEARYPGVFALLSPNAGVVVPGTESVREPDLALYRGAPSTVAGHSAWKDATPFLVVEVVSIRQARRDYEDKREDYLHAGVEEYWIVDPHKECLTVLTREGPQWNERVFTEADSYRPAILPEFELPVRLVLKGT